MFVCAHVFVFFLFTGHNCMHNSCESVVLACLRVRSNKTCGGTTVRREANKVCAMFLEKMFNLLHKVLIVLSLQM